MQQFFLRLIYFFEEPAKGWSARKGQEWEVRHPVGIATHLCPPQTTPLIMTISGSDEPKKNAMNGRRPLMTTSIVGKLAFNSK